MHSLFDRFARASAHALGTPWAFMVFLLLVGCWHALWALMGWHALWVDRLTLYLSILTQATAQLIRYAEEQNSLAREAKMDELIRVTADAHNELIGLEQRPAAEVAQVRRALDAPEALGSR